MTIHIKYFASLRDQLGRREDRLDTDESLTAAQIWSRLWPDRPMPPQVLIAVNKEYAKADTVVRDNDEVAYFPPVTGG